MKIQKLFILITIVFVSLFISALSVQETEIRQSPMTLNTNSLLQIQRSWISLEPTEDASLTFSFTTFLPVVEKNYTQPLVLIPVQPRPQEQADFCGEVCVQQSMYYFGQPISQLEINQAGGGDGVTGLWSNQILTALNNLNVKYNSWQLNSPNYWGYIEMLKNKLALGHPVLVGVKIYPDNHPEWFCDHFILLVGYNADSFIYNNGAFQEWRSFSAFQDGSVDDNGNQYTLTNPYNIFFGVEFMGP